MIIDRNLKKYIVFCEDPIRRALEKVDANDMRVIFVVDEMGVLQGILTDGDFRRWVLRHEKVDLDRPISEVANKNFQYSNADQDPEQIKGFFSDRIDYVPLLDEKLRLVAVASKRRPALSIGSHKISATSKTFIIAEVGNNHNGCVETARKLVDAAAESGADCVKFQMRDLEQLYSNKGNANDAGEDLGSQYVLDLLGKFQLTDEELFGVFDYCRDKRIIPLCTPWDESSADALDRYGIDGFKVASADFTNHDLLTYIAGKGKPMICSTGMSTEQEIKAGINLLHRLGAQFILLHCNSTYPAPFKDINLSYLERLQEFSDLPVGYSGHERGINVAIAASTMGARVIEKHLTLDRSMEGNDHKVSLLPSEFKQMVDAIRQIEEAVGSSEQRTVTQGELINRENLAKSIVASTDIPAGQIITEEMLEIKSPGKGLAPYRKKELIGRPSPRRFSAGDFFYVEDLDRTVVLPRKYNFVNPFGVAVRYHDIVHIVTMCPLDLVEIHLSYKDLEENIDTFIKEPFSQLLVVHSPELFSGDHILDLCSAKTEYRERSIGELQRVVDITRSLRKYFPNTSKPPIVVNVGGFSSNDFIGKDLRPAMYELLISSLDQVDQEGVEIIPQTMPPYPWHFGGQRYHNLFVDIDEIVQFCTKYHYRVCLDISHSKLACNVLKTSFFDFLERIAPHTAHMHIADASGFDGEGLQIKDGEIDFKQVMAKLVELMPNVSFIPEIWQGHKNNGQGFWVALERLERISSGL